MAYLDYKILLVNVVNCIFLVSQ